MMRTVSLLHSVRHPIARFHAALAGLAMLASCGAGVQVEPEPPSDAPQHSPEPAHPSPARPSDGDAKVVLQTEGQGSVLVCLRKAKPIDGPTSFVIPQSRLPANCLIQIDGAKGILQVSGSGTTTCDKKGEGVVCSPSSLP